MKINKKGILAVVVLLSALAIKVGFSAEAKNGSMTTPGPNNAWSGPAGANNTWSWDPLKEMDDIQRATDRMFRDTMRRMMTSREGGGTAAMTFSPDIDLQKTADHYLLNVDLPGIDKDKISVKTENGMLTISGERKVEKEEKNDQGFYRMESNYGSFARSVSLPPDANPDRITAEAKNGVLTVKIPRIATSAKTTSKVIPVE